VLADILYFVGCQAAFRGALAKIAVRMVQIMDKLQLNFTILGEDELCCGDPMQLTGGKDDDLLALARENTSRIDALGVKNVLFTCPGCYRMFTKVYPGLLGREPRFKSMMISEFLLQLIEDGKIQFNECPEIGRVTYHDPCDLGRHMDIYEPPRKILESIPNIDFVEMKNNREECACCGMGGGAAIHDMSFSKYQAKKKARDIDEIDAEVVVTHCPACFQGISESTNNLKKNGKEVIVMDLVELVAIALGIEK
ncbi:MAG: (Fe-S)-binding protein, partial [Candidatus Hodarchaeota archaeon]